MHQQTAEIKHAPPPQPLQSCAGCQQMKLMLAEGGSCMLCHLADLLEVGIAELTDFLGSLCAEGYKTAALRHISIFRVGWEWVICVLHDPSSSAGRSMLIPSWQTEICPLGS